MTRLDAAVTVVSARLMAGARAARPGDDPGFDAAVGDALYELFEQGASAGAFALADLVIVMVDAVATAGGMTAAEMWPAVVRGLRRRAGDG